MKRRSITTHRCSAVVRNIWATGRKMIDVEEIEDFSDLWPSLWNKYWKRSWASGQKSREMFREMMIMKLSTEADCNYDEEHVIGTKHGWSIAKEANSIELKNRYAEQRTFEPKSNTEDAPDLKQTGTKGAVVQLNVKSLEYILGMEVHWYIGFDMINPAGCSQYQENKTILCRGKKRPNQGICRTSEQISHLDPQVQCMLAALRELLNGIASLSRSTIHVFSR